MLSSFFKKPAVRRAARMLLRIALLLLAALLSARIASSVSARSKEEARRRCEEALLRAAVSCYAIEGFYPPDLAYLQEQYGLWIDREAFTVYYDLMGANVLPAIRVVSRGEGGRS